MTLTKEDLSAISQLLDVKLKAELRPIKDDIREISQHLENVDERLDILEQDVRDVKQRLKNVERDLADVKQRLENVEQRLENVEQHLEKVDERLDVLEQDLRNVKLHLENVTDRDIRLLSENYVSAVKRYEQAAVQMEAMQDDIDLLKKAVAEHSRKLQKIS